MTRAIISRDRARKYRYVLERWWIGGKGLCLWVMLNPSTADGARDDNTVRRCVGFARTWGYEGILVGNLYAYRATDPRALRRVPIDEATGPDNLVYLRWLARSASRIICAWGKPGPDPLRSANIRAALTEIQLVYAMGFTKAGMPRHPLMLPAATKPILWL